MNWRPQLIVSILSHIPRDWAYSPISCLAKVAHCHCIYFYIYFPAVLLIQVLRHAAAFYLLFTFLIFQVFIFYFYFFCIHNIFPFTHFLLLFWFVWDCYFSFCVLFAWLFVVSESCTKQLESKACRSRSNSCAKERIPL